MAGADRLPVVRRAGAEQPRHVGGEVLGDVLAQLVDPDRAVAAGREVGGPELTQAQGCADRCADQPALPVVRLDVEHRDLRVAELGAAGQGLERADQAGVTAPVGGEGVPGGGGAGSAEVGDHVAAAEGVDRLLRVADQDQRGVRAERTVEDVPLHGVGVLELVDQHHLPALPHALPGRCVVGLERVGEPAQQVVVGEDTAQVLAAFDLAPDGGGEVHAEGGVGARRGVERRQPGLGVADRSPGQLEGDGATERRLVGRRPEPLQVEVVGHLHHQVVEALDQLGTRVGVARDPERAQHQLAELVGGGDGGAVEPGQGVGDPLAALRDVVTHQVGEQRVGRVDRGRVGEGPLGSDQLVADPLAELLARGPAEGDHEHPVEGGDALGDVAGDQRPDRVGLAGAGARLEHRGGRVGGQRPEDVERRGGLWIIGCPAGASAARAASRGRRAGCPRRRAPRPGGGRRAGRRGERRCPTRRRGRRRRSRRGSAARAT